MTDSQELDLLPGNVKKAVGGASSGDLWMLQRSLIRRHPKLQPRDNTTEHYKERVRHLADLMHANGYDRSFPLKVFAAREDGQDVLYLVQGHTRLDAFDLAVSEGKDMEVIPCVTTDRGTTMEDLLVSTITGNEGAPLTPIEKAGIVRELQGCNVGLGSIARRLGYTLAYVKSLLSILEAPREVREMVQEGKVAASVAVGTVKEHGKQAGAVLKAGLEVAKAKGKDKVTPKHLRAAASRGSKPEAKSTFAAAAPAQTHKPEAKAVSLSLATAVDDATMAAMRRAAKWIAQETGPADEYPFLALVSTTLGLGGTAALQGLVNKARG
ncbi:ParB/RepB/Spo0J family partition protein [Verminephrobacter eiseniae]|uniref:ParB/Spo0J HTH domain-containing protein n=1 Tax=Verminephrobacter eiseniae (strain EF01-2) TaxID=391735 RepID=A1WP21_VEREI|nr:ParB/RepB/Spo0J family partition protein [Verminephrobacter eiseniae]ABM59378.1 hypothetical protein Veis_3662 [Verminephrobacter eiseniae EF01-2]MCW5284907.1 ParB/RepB/Spo0J family partition protein [Verminephrobacter eiseniae]MCW5302615.1 ParB/RepB/Spo0J family partition protein [Verminephrobacter eiseniae]MCW8180774.1 ParB/RepB/Spo0J family partition protein [Verminephrobacter eiseniae]MCW8192286.1 ParB/RepB/Spo0J family partition protein [Verminephrobacter eiseniae]